MSAHIKEQKLAKAEYAIEELADALGIDEKEIVLILEDGMQSRSPIANQLSETQKYFIDEMKATFDVY